MAGGPPATGCPKDGGSSQRAIAGTAERTDSASLLSLLERFGDHPHEHPCPDPGSAEAGTCLPVVGPVTGARPHLHDRRFQQHEVRLSVTLDFYSLSGALSPRPPRPWPAG